jgi:hypothetical protein
MGAVIMSNQKNEKEPEKDKWIEATAKLMWMTHDNRLRWERDELSKLSEGEIDAYTTEYKGRRLRLVEKEHEYIKALRRVSPPLAQDYGRRMFYVLEVIDEHGRRLSPFPQTSVLPHLMESVRSQCADIENFLDEILNEP